MKLTVLGFWGGYPGSNEASSAYLLEKDDFALVIDFGSGALSKLQQYKKVDEMDAVLLSHYHADHVADIGVLQHAVLIQSMIQKKECMLPIYGHMEDVASFHDLTDDNTKAVAYHPNETIKIGPFHIRFLRTKHSVPCYGMRITDGTNTLVYTADTAYFDEWKTFAKDADVLLSECNFYAGMDARAAGHLSSTEVAEIASGANVGEVILTHLPHFGDLAQLVAEVKEYYMGEVRLAHEGLVWQGE